MPKRLIIIRDYKPEATLGRILFDGREICKTLERPNLHNQKDDPNTKENESSCIPEGIYTCKKYSSAKYPDTWEVTRVPNRSAILFHSANYVNQLLGCIAPCTVIIDMNPKNDPKIPAEKKWMGSQSKDAFATFYKTIGGDQEFVLEITSTDSLCKSNFC